MKAEKGALLVEGLESKSSVVSRCEEQQLDAGRGSANAGWPGFIHISMFDAQVGLIGSTSHDCYGCFDLLSPHVRISYPHIFMASFTQIPMFAYHHIHIFIFPCPHILKSLYWDVFEDNPAGSSAADSRADALISLKCWILLPRIFNMPSKRTWPERFVFTNV